MVANTVGFLATGVKDGLLLSAYSSEMNDTFVMPRIVPATAFIAKESEAATQNSRRSFNSDETNSCSNIQRQDSENTDTIFKQISEAIEPIFRPLSIAKSKVLRLLGAECYGPRFLEPFEPMIKDIKCKLGLIDDRFMPAPPCDFEKCVKPALEESEITRDMGFANPEDLTRGQVNARGDCFEDVEPIMYGVRVQVTLLKDAPCEDYRYQKMCQEAMYENRVVSEDECRSPGYIILILYKYQGRKSPFEISNNMRN